MTEVETKKPGWLARLKSGLSRSKEAIATGITSIFTKRKLDDDMLEELQDLLITSDLGVAASTRVCASLAKNRFDKEISPQEVQVELAGEIARILEPVAKPLNMESAHKPRVILMVGVNGSGKTTTIGKLAVKFKAAGKSVILAAGDTFRAAAIEQLQVWGTRTGTPVISGKVGADPAGLAYEALDRAIAENTDVLIIDTAGRLQNKAHLMEELAKVIRVIKKRLPDAPHDTLLVLDATTGQNGIAQVEVFRELADISGLIMTKLDGTARGGVLVAVAEKFGLPIHAIGIGESVDDLQPFDATSFARALAGLGDA
jgi:fused signal recognition particle receptor